MVGEASLDGERQERNTPLTPKMGSSSSGPDASRGLTGPKGKRKGI